MKDFYSLQEYSINDIKYLIENEVEENIHLDYKSSGALAKDDKKRSEITKDVSSFANSDGGIIVYGLSEKEHKPDSISYVDGSIFTKEWLENVINMIQPRIDGVQIVPVRNGSNIKESIYVVKIPRSQSAPHMAKDKRYYKRFNFSSEPMEDYEVKDIFCRALKPDLSVYGFTYEIIKNAEGINQPYIRAFITNHNKVVARNYKLNFYLFFDSRDVDFDSISLIPTLDKPCCYVKMDSSSSKIAFRQSEDIYEGEAITMGNFFLDIPESQNQIIKQHLFIRAVLLYEGGKSEVLYNCSDDELIMDEIKIYNTLKEHFPKYQQNWL